MKNLILKMAAEINPDLYMDDKSYYYGYELGLQDGRVAAQWIIAGRTVNHVNLLSANDPYAIGYRRGLNQ